MEGDDGVPVLSLAFKPKPLSITVAPPACLYSHRISHGQLGIKFLKYRTQARGEKTLQVTLATEEDTVAELKALATMLDKILVRGNGNRGKTAIRRPLAPKSLNMSGGPFQAVGKAPVPATPPSLPDDLPPLSAEQKNVVDLVKAGKNVFFTGCAGTGKSLVLRHIIHALAPDTTYVTGTTGLAGSLLGGSTINSFAGTGRAGEVGADFDAVVRNAARGESGLRWRRATALLIDEISMMSGQYFDLLEAVARTIRGNNRPFGGLQLILSGDFHQLPPVSKDHSTRQFAFEADAWNRCVHSSVLLTQVFRQADDEFVDLLAAVRGGEATGAPTAIRTLIRRCCAPLQRNDGILPTQLFTHRADVDTINARQLAGLPGSISTFCARDSGNTDILQTSCNAPRKLELKIGAQVMLTRNLNARQQLVNGARGIVEKFTKCGKPVVKFANGHEMDVDFERFSIHVGGLEVATRQQIPLALAWAVTVHKSQGLTLDRVELSLERAFEPGMAYVALSRARSMEGLRIVGSVASAALQADPKVLQFYNQFT